MRAGKRERGRMAAVAARGRRSARIRAWISSGVLGLLMASGCATSTSSPSSGSLAPEGPTAAVETPDSGECIRRAMAENAEAVQLSTQDGNLTEMASPALVDYLAESWAGCLGTEGVSQLLAADLSVSGNKLPSETVSCLNESASGDEVALMRFYFAVVRQEPPAQDVGDTAAGHLSSCVPGSTLWMGQLPVPLGSAEVQCLDDSYRSAPEFAAYFRAQAGGQLTDQENAALAERAYECLDLSRQVLASQGGSEGLADSSLTCIDLAAEDYGILEGGITVDNDAAFDKSVRDCLTETG